MKASICHRGYGTLVVAGGAPAPYSRKFTRRFPPKPERFRSSISFSIASEVVARAPTSRVLEVTEQGRKSRARSEKSGVQGSPVTRRVTSVCVYGE